MLPNTYLALIKVCFQIFWVNSLRTRSTTQLTHNQLINQLFWSKFILYTIAILPTCSILILLNFIIQMTKYLEALMNKAWIIHWQIKNPRFSFIMYSHFLYCPFPKATVGYIICWFSVTCLFFNFDMCKIKIDIRF